MLHKKSEKGQAIIMIVFSIVGLIGLTALTVDGGMAYSDNRHAQGAVDSAVWAAGLANSRFTIDANGDGVNEPNIEKIRSAAIDIADQNGYANDDGDNDDDTSNTTRSDVYVSVLSGTDLNSEGVTIDSLCPDGSSPNVQITVKVTSFVQTFFAPVIGVEVVRNVVTAETRACGTHKPPLFGGNAIVSCGNDLGPSDCAVNTGSSGNPLWHINGGGLHSDTCIKTKNASAIDLDPDRCLDTVSGAILQSTGGASPYACGVPSKAMCTDDYLKSIMPVNPCEAGGVGVDLPSIPNHSNYVLDGGSGDGTVYCVESPAQLRDLEGSDVVLKNATIYINMDSFSLSYSGTNGSLSGTPSESGTYSSLSIVAKPSDTPCTGSSGPQSLDYRGNAGSGIYGTILAPTACVTLKGNAGSGLGASDTLTVNGQVVGNMVVSNGTIEVTVNYVEASNYRPPEDPTIQLIK